MVLIDPSRATNPSVRPDCPREGDFSVDSLRPEFMRGDPLQQFIWALYCGKCGVGFVPDEMAKPPPERWKLSPEGWRPVQPDGSLGPPRDRIA